MNWSTRFGFATRGGSAHHHSRSAERLTTPLIRENGKLIPATWDAALTLIMQKLDAAGENVGAIAGPMLSNEDLYELRRLIQGANGSQLGVWPANMTGGDLIVQVGVGSGTNFTNLGKGSTIVVIASDLEEEAPIWYLRAKVAAGRGAKLIVANARATETDRWTWGKNHVRYQYGQEVETLNGLRELIGETENLIVIVGGEGLDRAGHGALMQAAANLLIETGHVGKPNNGLLAVWPGANTQGAFDLGFTTEATESLLKTAPGVLFLADADVIGDDALSALPKGGFTVALELFMTETAANADVVLPRQSFAERDGSFTNGERRVQRFYTAQAPAGRNPPGLESVCGIEPAPGTRQSEAIRRRRDAGPDTQRAALCPDELPEPGKSREANPRRGRARPVLRRYGLRQPRRVGDSVADRGGDGRYDAGCKAGQRARAAYRERRRLFDRAGARIV